MVGASVSRVLAVDDHPLTLEILSAVLRKAFPGARVRVAPSLEQALGAAPEQAPPQLVVLDLGLPGCGGLEALARVKAAYPEAAVVVFSACDDGRTVREALRAGARGYIPKTTPGPRMLIALQLVAEGGVYVPPEAMAERKAEASSLPERQLEVLRLIGRGHSNRRIARAMGLSETTVKHHVSAILKALGASSRTEAIVVARRRGLISD
ncbi:MAG: response regulator transcription factor [Burkholderiales bacterium]|nr:response regulator transcription factor [Burkholderiales bacterium]